MNYTTLKKAVLAGAVSLIAFNASSAKADGYYNYGSSYECCDPCACPCDSNFYVGAEALFWKASNKDQNFGAVTTEIEVGPPLLVGIALQSADHDWNVGFRVFGGYKVDDCCDWELYLAYTNFCSRASGSFESAIIIGTATELDAAVSFDNHLKYQTFDALVATEFAFDHCGSIRPFFGFRGLWLDQDPSVSANLALGTVELEIVANSLDSKVSAYGLHGGTEYHWRIFDGFGVYGTIGASVLHADIDNVHTFVIVEEVFPDIAAEITIVDKQNAPMFGYLLGAGLRYETEYCACGTNIGIQIDLGYEFNHWLCTPQLLNSGAIDELVEVEVLGVERSNTGSLLLQGVRLGVGLYF